MKIQYALAILFVGGLLQLGCQAPDLSDAAKDPRPQEPAPSPGLTLRAVSPAIGPTAGGILVQLDGDGFAAGAAVQIGDAPISDILFNSPTRIVTRLPPRPGGFEPIRIVVTNPDGSSVSRDDLFHYYSEQIEFPGRSIPVQKGGAGFVIVGDFNGDQKPDLASSDSKSVSLLFGDGKGNFSPVSNFPLSSTPQYLAAGDFNGDHALDLVTANDATDEVSVLLGDGNGGFSELRYAIGTASGPWSLAVADFNGDQNLDLAVATKGSKSLFVYLGDGTGHLALSYTHVFSIGLSSNYLLAMAVGDFNGDLKPDLMLVANDIFSSARLLLGDGTGKFAAPTDFVVNGTPSSIAVGDINGDSKLDVVVTLWFEGQLGVLLGDGAGGFAPPKTIPVGARPYTVALADLNGDQKLDVVLEDNFVRDISVLLGNGAGGFVTTGHYMAGASSIAIADVNDDQKPDLAVGSIVNGVSLFLGDGMGGIDAGKEYLVVDFSIDSLGGMLSGDLDGDGWPDLVVASGFTAKLYVILNDRNGGFRGPSVRPISSPMALLALADFNGDQRLDLAATSNSGQNLNLLRGDGFGNFIMMSSISLDAGVSSLVVGDVNGDHNLDIVLTQAAKDSLSVFLGDGNGHLTLFRTYLTSGSPGSLALGELDGDKKLDLVLISRNSMTMSVLLGDGTGQFATSKSYSVGSNASVFAGDVDGDQRLDLIVNQDVSPAGTQHCVWLGDGTGSFAVIRCTLGTIWTAADLNGDQELDLIGSSGFERGDGIGSFSVVRNLSPGLGVPLLVGDFNRDLKPDLAVANPYSVAVFPNLSR